MNFTNILQVLSDDLATVSDKDCEMPTKEVTKNEIYQALQSFPSSKSPGPNGLNVEFYNFFFGMMWVITYTLLSNISSPILICLMLGVEVT